MLFAARRSRSVDARPSPRPTRGPCRRKLRRAWQAKTRALFKQAIEIPSVHNRGEVPRVAKLLADQFRAAGIPDADIHIMPYEALPGDQTEALIVRWRSPHATKKPMLILGHMDVVEAKREDWKYDPFVFREEGWLFPRPRHVRHEEWRRRDDHGRGQADERRVQARPRHHLLLQRRRGDPRHGRDARLDQVAQPDRRRVRAQRRRRRLRPTTAISGRSAAASRSAEKTFQTYFFTTHNPRRAQFAAAARQRDLRSRRRAEKRCRRTASSRC